MRRLADLPGLLTDAGSGDLVDQIDLGAMAASLPAMHNAVEACLALTPRSAAEI